jgi:hypothetical protein
MPTLGSDGGFQADNRGGVIDDQGNTIVTSDTSFAASPLGVAARTQALYGIPNANFNLTPPDPDSPIVANQNDLPYWSIEDLSDGQITATTVFDDATQTYGVELDPGTAATDSSLTLSTRSYLITDDNLALRQRALSVLSKSGTAGGTASQWNLQLSAIYYDANDTALSTAVIGTALDTATWTSFSGTTTPGGSAINSAAQYVDLTYTLATTAAVTGSVKATIKSLLLTTTTPAAGGGGFIVTETFTSSGTWTAPTGVDSLLAVIAYGGGGGGGSGQLSWGPGFTGLGEGSGGGGGSRLAILRDLALGTVTSVSVGIAAGGAGGTAQTLEKNTSGTAFVSANGADGATGGATTFGSYLSVPGGGGGKGGSATADSVGGSAAGAATTTVLGITEYAGGTGAQGGQRGTSSSGTESIQNALTAGTSTVRVFSTLSYLTNPGTNGSSGGSVIVTTLTTPATSGTSLPSASSGTAVNNFLIEGGGASPGGNSRSAVMGTASIGGFGAGGAGGGIAINISARPGTVTVTTGAGGAAGANTGSGGGGAGGAIINTNSSTLVMGDSRGTVISGAGGNGGSGLLTVVYIG